MYMFFIILHWKDLKLFVYILIWCYKMTQVLLSIVRKHCKDRLSQLEIPITKKNGFLYQPYLCFVSRSVAFSSFWNENRQSYFYTSCLYFNHILPVFFPTRNFVSGIAEVVFYYRLGLSHVPRCWLWGGRKVGMVRKFTCFVFKTGHLLRTCIARKASMFQTSLEIIRMALYFVVLSKSNTSTPSGRSG